MVVGIGMAVIVVIAGIVVFAAGEDLFGSNRTTIDSYNREVLETCEVPAGSTLVRSYVAPLTGPSGRSFRSMSFVYASPLSADELAAFYGVAGPGSEQPLPPARACRFGNRPGVLVLSIEAATREPATGTTDHIWGGPDAETTAARDLPPETRSVVRLRVAQREVEGIFGHGPFDTPTADDGRRPT